MQGGVEVYGKLNKRLDRQITTDAGCKTTAATVHDVGTGDSVVQARWVVHGCDMQVSSTSTPVLQPIADFDHGAIRKQHQQPHAAAVSLRSESRWHSSPLQRLCPSAPNTKRTCGPALPPTMPRKPGKMASAEDRHSRKACPLPGNMTTATATAKRRQQRQQITTATATTTTTTSTTTTTTIATTATIITATMRTTTMTATTSKVPSEAAGATVPRGRRDKAGRQNEGCEATRGLHTRRCTNVRRGGPPLSSARPRQVRDTTTEPSDRPVPSRHDEQANSHACPSRAQCSPSRPASTRRKR